MSNYSSDYLNLIQLDQGTFHQSKHLTVPKKILLIFQPPCSPEVNLIERFCQYLKQELSWKLYDELIVSLTGWNYILEAFNVA